MSSLPTKSLHETFQYFCHANFDANLGISSTVVFISCALSILIQLKRDMIDCTRILVIWALFD